MSNIEYSVITSDNIKSLDCIHLGSDHFWGFQILNFNIFEVFQKIDILGGTRFCGYFLGVITKLGWF